MPSPSRRFARSTAFFSLLLVLSGLHGAQAAGDPLSGRQWNMTQIRAASAQSVTTGGGVKIGIIDSGVNRQHPDLSGRVVASATCVGTTGSASQCQAGPQHGDDIDGHGTHVAGIMSALTGNGEGVSGVAPGAQLVVARVFSRDGNGEPTATLDDVKAGIRWLLDQGARVVNLSIGAEQNFDICQVFASCESPLKGAVEEVWQRGALPVIAAGNSEVYSSQGYGDLNAIVVGAVGRADTVAAYSTPIGNAKWGIVAPGGDPANGQDVDRMVLSTYTGSTCTGDNANACYAYLYGTSMAAPHVSAVAAMLFARGMNRQAVVDRLLATTDPVACGSNCAGRLNAAAAVGATTTDDGAGPGGPSGGNGGTTPNRRAPSTPGGQGTRSTATTAAATPTTATLGTFAFDSETTDVRRTPTTRRPQSAIVLNQPGDNDDVGVGVLLAGVISLAGAALALSYSLRKTLTTLP